ncbi:glycogen debranching N-terminal domain-containing protein [Georgenia subflava]|uniref:Amylo-alpha-1,6-glucosidase n=1 Tax=Georgenia subflava TaxID=1622177 RepID=A0A6N7EKG3_9MICO|nr:glycogen debranching N-terminal domain-containing protein [Georgenia subflava]MPV37297.1 amylo-alpha-1,6-glucosidase [Georgenia subflava]
MARQPFLHDLLVCLQAPTQVWSGADGQLRGSGVHGVMHADVRVLSRALLTVGGEEPEHLSGGSEGADGLVVVAAARAVDGPGADPTTRVVRRRRVEPGAVVEDIVLSAATAEPVRARLELSLGSDMATLETVKQGLPSQEEPADISPTQVTWTGPDGITTTVVVDGAQVVGTVTSPVLRWDVVASAGRPAAVGWTLTVTDPASVVRQPAAVRPEWSVPTVTATDRRLPAWVDQSLADLSALRMTSDLSPEDTFLAAGAPWFFTLFGRDSIWAARMLLPLGTELAAGTLRTLAAAQGTRTDPASAEQPGKILHEVRRAALVVDERTVLPPTYYGTIDATPLWVCLLHDAWRWGMPEDEVAALLPHLEAALAWMAEHGDADGDGFLEYVDESGTGLANQGWKDSGDSVQWRDGTLAEGTIALCEVQGYAHEAAVGGAALLDHFGRPGAQRWRDWAASLAERFRAAFWVADDDGDYPAIALDGRKRAVDSLTSNVGHLLGTGLLSHDEEERVVRRLTEPSMSSGYGLRTLSERSGGYWPLRYHGGAVWPHDTAIVISSMARAGFAEEAGRLGAALLEAAADFDFRLPELFAGDARGTVPAAVPYPAACRPQAWSAASAVVVLSTALGLDVDVPAGTVSVRPVPGALGRGLAVEGLRAGGAALDLTRDDGGRLTPRSAAGLRSIGA